MSFEPRTLAAIEQDMLAAAIERLPEIDWSRGGEPRLRLQIFAVALWHLQEATGRVERDILPDLAEEAGLARWGAILALPRNGATVASREAALRVRGTPSTSVPAGTALTSPLNDGAQFEIATSTIVGAAGFVDADVASITTGSRARLDAGAVLEFDSPPAGIETEAALVLDLLGGNDEEPLDQYRARIIRRFSETGALITVDDWASAIEALDGVDDAYIYPLRDGPGTVDVAALRDAEGAVRVLPDETLTAIAALIDERRPVTLNSYRVLEVVTRSVAIEVQIKERPTATAPWDFGDENPTEITAYDPDTKTLTLDGAPADLAAGDRLVIDGVNSQGQVITVVAVSGDDVTIENDFGYTFTASDQIYAAGSLTKPARDALVEYLAELGPSLGTTGGEWDDTIRTSLIEAAVFAAVGDVREVDVVLPAADEEPDEPPIGGTSDQVELLIPSSILVRRLP